MDQQGSFSTAQEGIFGEQGPTPTVWVPTQESAEVGAVSMTGQGTKKRKTANGSDAVGQADVPNFLHDYMHDDGAQLDDGFGDAYFVPTGTGQSKAPKRVCDIINQITYNNKALKFDPTTELFTVTDGVQFEREFASLKTFRAGEKDGAGRVFAQMYRTYQIISGERWGATGTVFRSKKKDVPLPFPGPLSPDASTPQDSQSTMSPIPDGSHGTSNRRIDGDETIDADRVQVTVRTDGISSQVSLQHFLDVTGAGELYSAAIAKHRNEASADTMDWIEEWRRDQPLRETDVHEVVGGVWNASSKGDQAYFFKRRGGMEAERNGSIVGVVGGVVVPASEVEGSGGLYMVVSDDNAKWKGEPIPSSEEEERGHWCCFLGQVPVVVHGKVKTGDHIGPSFLDGTGMVTGLGKGPVVGVALMDKATAQPGIVKVLCFAGLNAVAAGGAAAYNEIFEKAVVLERRVDVLEAKVGEVGRQVEKVDHRMDLVEAAATDTSGRVAQLEQEVGMMRKLTRTLRREEGGLSTKEIWIGVVILLVVFAAILVAVLVTALKPDKDKKPLPLPPQSNDLQNVCDMDPSTRRAMSVLSPERRRMVAKGRKLRRNLPPGAPGHVPPELPDYCFDKDGNWLPNGQPP